MGKRPQVGQKYLAQATFRARFDGTGRFGLRERLNLARKSPKTGRERNRNSGPNQASYSFAYEVKITLSGRLLQLLFCYLGCRTKSSGSWLPRAAPFGSSS
jgi:hypothetical protein